MAQADCNADGANIISVHSAEDLASLAYIKSKFLKISKTKEAQQYLPLKPQSGRAACNFEVRLCLQCGTTNRHQFRAEPKVRLVRKPALEQLPPSPCHPIHNPHPAADPFVERTQVIFLIW